MTKLYDILREFLEEVQTYLQVTLNTEILSANALSRKESLLLKIQHVKKEIPLLIKIDESGVPVPPPRPPPKAINMHQKEVSGPKSPAPYLDMQGSASSKPALQPSPVAEHKFAVEDSSTTDDYESYECESEISLESSVKSVNGQSEDNLLDGNTDRAVEAPEIPASDLIKTADKCGLLEKKGKERLAGLLNPFQRRWCAIKDGLLIYYNDPGDRKQRASISLESYEGRPSPSACKDPNKKAFCFEIVSPGKRTYQFIACSVKDMKQWIAAIEKNSKVIPNTDLPEQLDNTIEKSALPSVKSLPQINLEELSAKLKAKVPPPASSSPEEDIYEALDDEQLYEEGASRGDMYDHEEIYIDADTEAPKGHQNNSDFKAEEWYVGLWDCMPADTTELEFRHGDLIRIVSKEFDKHDWWTGELNGKIGFVPKAYLQEAFEKP